ncbi:hypothetical protein LNTAR_23054 [Lentisphaera araneosa HTCC2155]|uniref:Cytochrome c domain-containing protein n=1 Tax=Lentisphaera araneosa HTCC2155 TaxID=313628 RepID=A6DGK2_9BACT|nr:hypothetical protein LNTAR_23054 [Lentisphaera araneosa HTCC2155]
MDLEKLRSQGRERSELLRGKAKKINYQDKEIVADIHTFKKKIYPILQENCLDCHGPKKSKGRFRVDTLDADLLKGKDINDWLEVFDVLTNQEMPPEDEPDYHLEGEDRSLVINWLGEEMNKAKQVKREDNPQSSFRRMTKIEYNYALQDLLGVDFSFADDLAPETVSEDGFSNSSEHLKMTAMQFQTYHELGLKALKKVTIKGPQPKPMTYRISPQDLMELSQKNLSGRLKSQLKKKADKLKKAGKNQEAEEVLKQDIIGIDLKNNKSDDTRGVHILDLETGRGWAYRYGYSRARWAIKPDQEKPEASSSSVRAVIPWAYDLKLDLGNFLPNQGNMRVKVRAGRDQIKDNEYSSIELLFGGQTSNNANFITRATEENLLVKGTKEKPQTVQFEIALSEMQRNPFLRTGVLGETPTPSEVLTIKHHSNGQSQLLIDSIEISAPIYEQWPPQSHQDIFIASKDKSNEEQYAQEVIQNFAEKAWCRKLNQDELRPLINLYKGFRPRFKDFDDAVLEVLATILASPEFLYIAQGESMVAENQKSNDLGLAHRLSHFLWKSRPDKHLIDLARAGKLSDKAVLNHQIERMLTDPKADRFVKNFVEEWLGVEALENVIFDKKVFTSYRAELKEDMKKEIVFYFAEVLKNNGSIIDFLHSDYLVINERLAKHYGIENIYGEEFRRVKLNNNYQRGGLLTSSGLLAMNSNGKESNPLKRGIWMLENVLHDPPPPAPPNVPEVDLTDPKILQMTLKERMEDHRNHDACRSCHAKIDPWGIAFENYDALGQFRDKQKGKPIDASATLFNKHQLDGIKGLKAYLLSDRQDQFTEAMIYKMTAYALGRSLSFNDKSELEEMGRQLRQSGDGLKDMISIIITSQLFLNN